MKRWMAVAALCVAIFLWWATRVTPGSIVIERYGSVDGATNKMFEAGIIRSPLLSKIFVRVFMRGAEVYPGTVTIPSGCGWFCAMGRLVSADRSIRRITFPEGDDIRDMQKRLVVFNTGIAKQFSEVTGESARFTNKDTTLEEKFDFLRGVPKRISYEGYLFPDTYEVDQTQQGRVLVVRMLENFDRKFDAAMRTRVATAGHTVHDVVTVASILEKEVRGERDRRLVADILWRRAAAGWGLQVDASVNYVTGKSGRFTTAADRASLSPWNTYKHRGLPPGPIGNPGLDTLEAALDPEQNKFWFYLTASDGTVHYGRTLEEHMTNKKYLK